MKKGMKMVGRFIWMHCVLMLSIIGCVAIWPEQHKVFAIVGGLLFIPLVFTVFKGLIMVQKDMKELIKNAKV